MRDQSTANRVTPVVSQDTSAFTVAPGTRGVTETAPSVDQETTWNGSMGLHHPISVNHVMKEQQYTTRTRQIVINSWIDLGTVTLTARAPLNRCTVTVTSMRSNSTATVTPLLSSLCMKILNTNRTPIK